MAPRRRLQRPRLPPNLKPQRQLRMTRKTTLKSLGQRNHLRRGKSLTKVARVKAKTKVREKAKARIRVKGRARTKAKARARIREKARVRKVRVSFSHAESPKISPSTKLSV